MKNIVQETMEYPIQIEKLSFSCLEKMLNDGLLVDDICDYQKQLFEFVKKYKSENCPMQQCKLLEILLKEIIIIQNLVDWVLYLASDHKSKWGNDVSTTTS